MIYFIVKAYSHLSDVLLAHCSSHCCCLYLFVFVITSLQDIYKYIPETILFSRVYSVAAVLYLQFVLHVMLFHLRNMFCTFTLLLLLLLIYSHLSVIRQWSSGKSRSQQEIKAIYPISLQMTSVVLIIVIYSSVADR